MHSAARDKDTHDTLTRAGLAHGLSRWCVVAIVSSQVLSEVAQTSAAPEDAVARHAVQA